MEPYIKKSDVAAGIEKTYKFHEKRGNEHDSSICDVLYGLSHRIDNIKVKEVDLEKEAELIANGVMIGVQANRYNTVVYNTKRNDFNHSHLMLTARKGIELGLKAVQKGE